MRRTATLCRHHALWGTLGILAFIFAACSDSIHLDPTPDPTGGSTGGAGPGGSGPGGGGTGGGFGMECSSNTDCSAPAAICDTVQHKCVECLEFADCAFRPGTVCSLGHCVCPNAADSYCDSPARCVNLMVARDDCGQCGHGCFGTCNGGTCGEPWEPTSLTGAPAGRSQHVAVWTGTRMVVWGGSVAGGGLTNTGGIFDPTGRSWTETSTANAPSPRRLATAVWTGTAMVVWGGLSGGALNTGGIFDPVTNTWKTISTSGAPSPRYYHTAVWTGPPDSKMVVWGGFDGSAYLGDGGVYDPAGNTWTTLPASSPLFARREHTAVWAGANMIVWGGYGYDPNLLSDTYFNDGAICDLSGSWTSLAASPLAARAQHTAVWADASKQMIVWGGWNGSAINSGAQYDYNSASWATMMDPSPSGRQFHRAVWLAGDMMMIMWGGQDASVYFDSGAIYRPGTTQWDLNAMPAAPTARVHHTAVETGTTMIIWGGVLPNGNVTNDGAIFNPAFMP